MLWIGLLFFLRCVSASGWHTPEGADETERVEHPSMMMQQEEHHEIHAVSITLSILFL